MGRKAVISVIAAAIIILAASCLLYSKNDNFKSNSFAMNTFIDINITGKKTKETGNKILNLINKFDENNSMYIESSFVSGVNNSAGKSYVHVDKDTYDLIKRTYLLCEQSGGKFDVTIAPVVLAWNINGDNPHIPEIDENLLSLVNYKDILFNDENSSIMLKNPNQKIDLGGIAKGSVCDKIYEILKTEDVKEAAISVGGNVIAFGNKSYNVGIKHPRKQNGLIASVKLNNKIISTTGDYERYFEIDGKRYHHIIDPKSGQPYNSDFYCVTVIGQDGAFGDYMSTRLFMTPKDELISMLENYDIIAVGKDNTVYASPNLEIELKDSSFKLYKG